jgi:hypothetical protein
MADAVRYHVAGAVVIEKSPVTLKGAGGEDVAGVELRVFQPCARCGAVLTRYDPRAFDGKDMNDPANHPQGLYGGHVAELEDGKFEDYLVDPNDPEDDGAEDLCKIPPRA